MGKYLNDTGLQHFMSLIKTALSGKQATLVSGTNIKTVNNESLLGSGNITISGGSGSYLPLSGGTLTGALNIEDQNIDRFDPPSAAIYDRVVNLNDVNGETIGFLQLSHGTDGATSVTIGAQNSDDSSQNQVMMGFTSSDSPFVWISHNSAWRSALGLGSLATKSSVAASDITSGALSLARGGTGVDGTNSGLNAGEFLASSPTAVNPMDIGFRRIVASDLPDLSESYLPLSGGTLTGAARQEFSGNKNWSHKDTVVNLKASNNGLSSGTRYHEWLSYDKNGLIPGGVTNTIASSGNVTTILRSRNYKSDESAVDNQLTLTVAKNGTRTVSVSEAAPWRTALGLGTAATHAHGDYAPSGDYWTGDKGGTSYWGLVNPDGASTGWVRTPASGLLPAASGGGSSSLGTSSWPFTNLYATNIYHNGTKLGTAATHADTDYADATHSHSEYFSDQVNRTANTVLAAPNGSAGHASFRRLAMADLVSSFHHNTSHANIPVVTTAPTAVNTSNWNYEVYSDGEVHAWGTFMRTVTLTTKLGDGFYWNSTLLYLALPVKAKFIQSVNYSMSLGGSGGAGAYCMPGGSAHSVWSGATFYLPFYIARPVSTASQSYWFSVDVWYMKA